MLYNKMVPSRSILEDVPRPRPSDHSGYVGLRVPTGWIARIDALAERAACLGLPGVEVTRSDVLRAALARGIEALEAEVAGSAAR